MSQSQQYINELFSLEGQVAVVIGATGVLGGAIAEGIAQAGATVIVAGRNAHRGNERVNAIEHLNHAASFLPVDVKSRESIEKLLRDTVEGTGRVDMLVNCAGVNSSTPYEEISEEDWAKVVDTNLSATHRACQVFAPHMAAHGGGAILNIGSVTSDKPLSKVFAYSAAKAGVINLTQNVAREYGTRGVRVNAICPGFFPAEQNRKLLNEERRNHIFSQTPMDRYGEPHELIGAVLLLLSKNAGSFITGAAYYVDGGFTAMRF